MKKTLVLKWLTIGIFLAACAAVFALFGTYTRPQKDVRSLTPFLNDANGWEIYTIDKSGQHEPVQEPEALLQLAPGIPFYLSRTLTAELEADGYTFLLLQSYSPCAVFLDGELLYTNCPGAVSSMEHISFPASFLGLSARAEAFRCSLPEPIAGKKLTIASAFSEEQEYYSMPMVQLSSYAIESELSMKGANAEMIPAAGYAILTLFLFGIWLFVLFQRIRMPHILLLILTAFLQALAHLRQYEFLSPASTAMDTPLALFIPSLSMLLPAAFLLLEMNSRQNRIRFGIVLGISAVIALISPAAGLFAGGLPFDSPFLEANEIFYVTLTALLIFSILEARQKNMAFRIFLSGLSITIFSTALIYACSLLGSGYYSSSIRMTLMLILYHSPYTFFNWCAVLLFLLSAIISLYQVITRMIQTRTNLALQTELSNQLDSQLQSQKEFYEARLVHEEETRALRHDMMGHLKTLSSLLDSQNTTEARSYLYGILRQHDTPAAEVFSSNPYINAVLGSYACRCRENHIELAYHIDIKDCELPATELCLILNNALQNAFEAVMMLPEPEQKIKVTAAVHHHMLLLRVSNPFHGTLRTKNDLPSTTKTGTDHGYGLSNIRRAAERRGGSMEYHTHGGSFILDVALPVIRQEEV